MSMVVCLSSSYTELQLSVTQTTSQNALPFKDQLVVSSRRNTAPSGLTRSVLIRAMSSAAKFAMQASRYTFLALAVTSVVWGRDSAASVGRSLLSHDVSGNETATGMLVTYWGQNSAAPKYQEPSLDQVCAQYNITAIAFLAEFGQSMPLLPNVAGHNISEVGPAITACQSYGAKILLSMGGQGGDSCGYGFSSGEDAAETALNIWELFLGGYPTKSTATRPFGNATLDGVDLDIECAANGTDPMYYTTFVQQLRSLMQNGSSSSAATESLDTEYAAVETTLGTANYLITAAPQCVFPDAYLGPQLAGLALTDAAMQFDYLWPQFYNNHICQYNEADKGAGFQQSFQNWSSWANATAPALEVLVGLPASPSAASTGYIADSDEVKQINMIRRSNATNFDGVMLWSAAWEFENEQMNQSYIPSVLKSLTDRSGADAQQVARSATFVVMALALLCCLL